SREVATADAPGKQRPTSIMSLVLAAGGILVGVGSLVVALRARSPAADRAPETGASTVTAPTAVPPPPTGAPAVPAPPAASPAAKTSSPDRGNPEAAGKAPEPPPSPAEGPAATETASLSAADRDAVEAAIRSYASALDSGSVVAAQRVFPAM